MKNGKFSIKGIVDHKTELFKEQISSLRLTSGSYFKISGCLDSYLFLFSNCHSQVNVETEKETKELNLYYFKTLPPGVKFAVESISAHNDIYLFYFSKDLIFETASRYKVSPLLIEGHLKNEAFVRKNNWLNEILHRYFFEIFTEGAVTNSATDFLEKEIVKEVYYLGVNRNTKYCDRLNLDSQFLSGKSELVKNLLLLIEADLDSDLSLAFMAKKIVTSVSTIKRKFQDEIGVSVHRYIQTRRLEEAQKLLIAQKINVNEVCSRVGFQSPSTFNALFKKKYGVSPGKFGLIQPEPLMKSN